MFYTQFKTDFFWSSSDSYNKLFKQEEEIQVKIANSNEVADGLTLLESNSVSQPLVPTGHWF